MSLAGICPLVLLALLTVPALAQDSSREEPRGDKTWYRVELIIFTNRDPEAALAEAWPPLPELAYPENWRGLEDGATTQAADREFALLRVEDTAPKLLDLYWDRSVASLVDEYEQRKLLRRPRTELEPLFDLTVPRPFVLQPPEARELNDQRRRIDNSAGLDVLFHESWLQRMESREQSVPLVIEAGPRFGDYPELQGSLLLYSGRYLHIATNLWLNTDGSYLDIGEGDWRMPPPPPPPVRESPEIKPFKVDLSADWLAGELLPGAEPVREERETAHDEALLYDLAAGDDPAADDPVTPGNMAIPATVPPEDAAAISPAPAGDQYLRAFLEEPVRNYDFRHAVLVKQQRRMRSDELHYIDHPMVGIVIRVSRYEFEPFITAPENPGLLGMR